MKWAATYALVNLVVGVHDDGARLEEAIDTVDEALLLILGQGGTGAGDAGLEAPVLGGLDHLLEQLLANALLLLSVEVRPLLIRNLRHLVLFDNAVMRPRFSFFPADWIFLAFRHVQHFCAISLLFAADRVETPTR